MKRPTLGSRMVEDKAGLAKHQTQGHLYADDVQSLIQIRFT